MLSHPPEHKQEKKSIKQGNTSTRSRTHQNLNKINQSTKQGKHISRGLLHLFLPVTSIVKILSHPPLISVYPQVPIWLAVPRALVWPLHATVHNCDQLSCLNFKWINPIICLPQPAHNELDNSRTIFVRVSGATLLILISLICPQCAWVSGSTVHFPAIMSTGKCLFLKPVHSATHHSSFSTVSNSVKPFSPRVSRTTLYNRQQCITISLTCTQFAWPLQAAVRSSVQPFSSRVSGSTPPTSSRLLQQKRKPIIYHDVLKGLV
jgi:hypothetical protein